MNNLPTEILLQIFGHFTPKELFLSRITCSRWKNVIDRILSNEEFWKKFCAIDFPTLTDMVRYKCKPDLPWRSIYISLTLWSQLEFAQEIADECAVASSPLEEIQDFQIVKNGMIGVHTRTGIRYYDSATLRAIREPKVPGQYLKYMENDYATLFMCANFHLIIMRKMPNRTHLTYEDVKMFTCKDNHVYFVNMNDDLVYFDLNDPNLECSLVHRFTNQIITIAFQGDNLNILTSDKFIYSVIDKEVVLQSNVILYSNMLDEFHKFNLLENLDWRVCIEWMSILHIPVPEGPLRDIMTIRTYGDLFFVGTNWGVLRIYYKPYINNQLDLINSEPIKQFNFMETRQCPVLSNSSIIKIDAVEIEGGHMVIIGMPKKLAILKFVHEIK